MGPDEVNLQALREPADEVAKLSIIFEKLWQSHEVPIDWKRRNRTPSFKKGKNEDLENYRPKLASVPGRIMKQILLEIVLRRIKNKGAICGRQHNFLKTN